MTLAEALANVPLEDGQTYGCVVNGRHIIVRVGSARPIAPSARYDESDVMYDAWCELPQQGKPIPNVTVKWGKLPIDIPEMPTDEE